MPFVYFITLITYNVVFVRVLYLSGSDAILKDANDEFKIIDFVHLVKISSE